MIQNYSKLWTNPKTKMIFGYFAHGLVVIGIAVIGIGASSSATVEEQEVYSTGDTVLIPEADSLNNYNTKIDAVSSHDEAMKQKEYETNKKTVSDADFYANSFDNNANENIPVTTIAVNNSNGVSTTANTYTNKSSPSNNSEKISKVNEAVYGKQTTETTQTATNTQHPVDDGKKKRNVGDTYGNMGYGYTKGGSTTDSDFIKSVIHNGDVAVKSGSEVQIRISENSVINGVNVPANTMVKGLATITKNRVTIQVNSIWVGGVVHNVKLGVFSLDGIEGVYVPNSINDEIAKDGVQQGGTKAGTVISVPVVGSISTDAFNKKVSEPSVILKNGTKVVLKKL